MPVTDQVSDALAKNQQRVIIHNIPRAKMSFLYMYCFELMQYIKADKNRMRYRNKNSFQYNYVKRI